MEVEYVVYATNISHPLYSPTKYRRACQVGAIYPSLPEAFRAMRELRDAGHINGGIDAVTNGGANLFGLYKNFEPNN